MIKSRALASLVFVLIIFQHFQLFSLGGYPVTVGLFAGLACVIVGTRKRLARTVPIVIVVGGYSALVALMSPIPVEGEQFVRTLSLVLVSALIIGWAVAPTGAAFVVGAAVKRAMLLALYAVVILSVSQVALGHFGSEALFNPFGENQYLYQYKPHLQWVVFPRAQGFYLEPSYDAFVIGTVAAALFVLKFHRRQVGILAVAGLIVCQSATGLLVLILIMTLGLARARVGAALLTGVLLVAVLGVAGTALGGRLSSIFSFSSSANYRLVAPLQAMGDTLTQSPLGRPLGSISQVLRAYDLRNGTDVGSSLDNGFYVVVFYFGWVGIVALIALVVWVAAAVSRSMRAGIYSWVAPVWILASLSFSGGIVLPEYALMIWLLISCYRTAERKDLLENDDPVERCDRNLPRPGRTPQDA